ncbi:hypothetical protein ACFPGO_02620 [Arcanobacterium canis]|uniref:Uncharacterized protein n=1 Tax=Arcanobacterium canis TaxID=999183 RepID=A0ABY8G1A4_9ACTO|nr:hypothetical protein [Arcanobacterium canis]WFM83141.1 hypothetical protein P7079_07030 [Arcanobacterium canis]
MKIGLILWGALLVAAGVFAALVGLGIHFSLLSVVVAMLVVFALVCAAAAALPAMVNRDKPEESDLEPWPIKE